jgi:hypothetical protein
MFPTLYLLACTPWGQDAKDLVGSLSRLCPAAAVLLACIHVQHHDRPAPSFTPRIASSRTSPPCRTELVCLVSAFCLRTLPRPCHDSQLELEGSLAEHWPAQACPPLPCCPSPALPPRAKADEPHWQAVLHTALSAAPSAPGCQCLRLLPLHCSSLSHQTPPVDPSRGCAHTCCAHT